MRTIIENRADLDTGYVLEDLTTHNFDDISIPVRSCFYDFGAERKAVFSGFSEEEGSLFAKEMKKFFD